MVAHFKQLLITRLTSSLSWIHPGPSVKGPFPYITITKTMVQQQQCHHRRPQHSRSITSMTMLLKFVPYLFLSHQYCVVYALELDHRKPTSLIRGSNPTYSDEHHTASALTDAEKIDVDVTSSHSQEEWSLSPSERRALVSFDAFCFSHYVARIYIFHLYLMTNGLLF